MICFSALYWASVAKTEVKSKIKHIYLRVRFQQLILKTSANKANIAVMESEIGYIVWPSLKPCTQDPRILNPRILNPRI